MSSAGARNAARIAKYGPGLRGYWRQGYHEYPEILSTAGLFFATLPIALYKLKIIEDGKLDIKVHKKEYIVYRHDDPRIHDLPKHDPNNWRL
ncbi:hypothetical protein LSTR_LSTR006190 [Laodelphax striatellus]|uniref:Uncharacterized protein n=1 Tax=Laodelphax striatellus TaxID=195883 RepID=A0A482XQF7_LAOST|nr:hypothetical protein LSTR_LSTR006190 [Laodelphax striatellus]